MYQNILVPYDGSEPAKHALTEAVALINGTDTGRLTVLKVEDRPDFNSETFKIAARMAGVSADAMEPALYVKEEADKASAQELAGEIADQISTVKDAVSAECVSGSPHDAICAYASQNDFDCIIMGHRGRGTVRNMLGSVCYSVLNKTTIPVLIVK